MDSYSTTHYRRKIQELTLLFNLSQILDRSVNLAQILDSVLATIASEMGTKRGLIALLNRQTIGLTIECSYGLTPEQKKKGRYRLGEGIVGKVAESGKAIVVPDVSKEPVFLGRTGKSSWGNSSFLCVPIKIVNDVIGVLGVDRLFGEEKGFEEDLRLLSIIASLIARAVELKRGAEEERQRLEEENLRLHHDLEEFFRPSNIIGNSRAMQEVYQHISQVADSDATVLIRGESGTGKELVAGAIHYGSSRASAPFIKVNCAALPEGVIDSELFGHKAGAFTGAVKSRRGRFEEADGGTIFLDEIGDLSPFMQVKLLRVLQEREFEPIGANEPVKVDVRVIAATNRNLEEAMAGQQYREDLYYRLNVFPIHVPPLRERKGDITLLADYFVEKFAQKNKKEVKRIASGAIDLLMSYHWPGNVRELENSLERAVLITRETAIHARHLPPSLQSAESSGSGAAGTLDAAIDALEQDLLLDALKNTRGNMKKAAEILGITERVMGLRIAKYSIDYRRFR